MKIEHRNHRERHREKTVPSVVETTEDATVDPTTNATEEILANISEFEQPSATSSLNGESSLQRKTSARQAAKRGRKEQLSPLPETDESLQRPPVSSPSISPS